MCIVKHKFNDKLNVNVDGGIRVISNFINICPISIVGGL